MIYSFCIDDVTDEGPNKLSIIPSVSRSGNQPFHEKRLAFYNLTRVCRLIRAEFRPMYLRETPKCMPIGVYESYIADFHPHTRYIVDDVWLNILELCSKDSRMNLLPLLRFLSQQRHFYCAFKDEVRRSMGAGLVGLKELLNECVWQIASPEWRRAAARVVSVIPNKNTKRVVVNMETRFREKHAVVRKGYEHALLNDLGLNDGGRWKAIIKYV